MSLSGMSIPASSSSETHPPTPTPTPTPTHTHTHTLLHARSAFTQHQLVPHSCSNLRADSVGLSRLLVLGLNSRAITVLSAPCPQAVPCWRNVRVQISISGLHNTAQPPAATCVCMNDTLLFLRQCSHKESGTPYLQGIFSPCLF